MANQKLTALAALASLSADDLFYVVDDPAGAANQRKMAASVLDARYLQVANNLSDLAGAAAAQTNLGLGTLATVNDAPSDGSTYGRNNGAWAAVSAGSVLPVADTGTIVKGSADATKLLRFEIDGFAAGATRVMTPPDADIIVAGKNLAQLWTANQTFNNSNRLHFNNTGSFPAINAPLEIEVDSSTGNGFIVGLSSTDYLRFVNGGVLKGFLGVGTTPLTFSNSAADLLFSVASVEAMRIDDSTKYVGIGIAGISVTAPASRLHVVHEVGSTTTVTHAQVLEIFCAGTPGTGFGQAFEFKGKSSTTISQYMGRIHHEWATATHASRKARAKWTVYDTAEREAIRIEASGTAPMLGVLGATAIIRQAHIADPSDGAIQDAEARTAINSILLALENFGFLATS